MSKSLAIALQETPDQYSSRIRFTCHGDVLVRYFLPVQYRTGAGSGGMYGGRAIELGDDVPLGGGVERRPRLVRVGRVRAILEGARDSGKITESGDQGFGGPGSSRVSKPSKPAVVTKEELAKSGYDNLRDYLNAKQGLTRRKEKTPTPKLIDPSNIRSGPRFDDEGLIDPSNIRSGRRPEEEALLKTRAKGMKNGGSVKKMASGGSASSRADGIAVKGKTRGRMC